MILFMCNSWRICRGQILIEPAQTEAQSRGHSLGQSVHLPQPAHGASAKCVREICIIADGALLNILDTRDPSGCWQGTTDAQAVLTVFLCCWLMLLIYYFATINMPKVGSSLTSLAFVSIQTETRET